MISRRSHFFSQQSARPRARRIVRADSEPVICGSPGPGMVTRIGSARERVIFALYGSLIPERRYTSHEFGPPACRAREHIDISRPMESIFDQDRWL